MSTSESKVETISRFAQWKVDCYSTSTYRRSDAFKVGLWNWHLAIERSRSVCIRLFPESGKKEQPPIAKFLLRVAIAGANRRPFTSPVINDRLFRSGDDFLWPIDVTTYGRYIIDVEFLDLKISSSNSELSVQMESKTLLWRKRPFDNPLEVTEISGAASSRSEQDNFDQEVAKTSPDHVQSQAWSPKASPTPSIRQSHTESPNTMVSGGASDETLKSLSEKLSSALVNVSAKEDLVKKNAKVAEEAVAGWEKAETEAIILHKKLEAVTQENSVLQERVRHLDAILKECVWQLHRAKEEQQQKISETLAEKTREWDACKSEIENRVIELETQLKAANADSAANMKVRLKHAEQENDVLKRELVMCTEELEVRSIERDLSTQSAESASKQQLESIKKVARLEAECRKLRALVRKTSSGSLTPQAAVQEADHRSVSSSVFVESLVDSQSDNGDHLLSIENDLQEIHGSSSKGGSLELNEKEPGCSDSWAFALIAELDQFKNEKVNGKKNSIGSGHANLSLMDDFLEMEKLAASENGGVGSSSNQESSMFVPDGNRSSMREELEAMHQRVLELEEQVEKLTLEKPGLETALHEYQEHLDTSSRRLMEVEPMLVELQQHLASSAEEKKVFETEIECALEQKAQVEIQLQTANASINTMNSAINLLNAKLEEEKAFSAMIKEKCEDLEETLTKRNIADQEADRARAENASYDLKMKREELADAAGRLAECQKTIASLSRQLKTLASFDELTLDANTVDPNKVGPPIPSTTALSECSNYEPTTEPSAGGKQGESPSSTSSSSSSSSSATSNSEKTKNGFGRFFFTKQKRHSD